MIKIALADDENLFREAVSDFLEKYPHYEVIYSVSDGSELISELEQKMIIPDVFILDLKMKSLDGIETTKILSQKYKDCKIIILTSHYSPSFINYMVSLGINAFLSKTLDPKELIFAIDMVVEKGLYLTEDYAKAIRSKAKSLKKPSFSPIESLTKREIEVLEYICLGYTNQEISEKIFRSVRTIEGHRKHIMEKTRTKNTAGIVVYALVNKIINIDEKYLEFNLN